MNKTHKYLTNTFILATLVVNFAATSLPLNGKTTADISDSIPSFFVPAGYVFAIWGVIYLGLIAFGLYQTTLNSQKGSWLKSIYPWFYLSSIANMVWIFLWHYEQIQLSVLVMLTLLVSLIMIYRKLEIGIYSVSAKTRWMVHIPFSIYLGWISVATIANISGALVVSGWDAFGLEPQLWSAIMIGVATALTLIMLARRRDIAFALVIVWALVGIGVKFQNEGLIAGAVIVGILGIVTKILPIPQIGRSSF